MPALFRVLSQWYHTLQPFLLTALGFQLLVALPFSIVLAAPSTPVLLEESSKGPEQNIRSPSTLWTECKFANLKGGLAEDLLCRDEHHDHRGAMEEAFGEKGGMEETFGRNRPFITVDFELRERSTILTEDNERVDDRIPAAISFGESGTPWMECRFIDVPYCEHLLCRHESKVLLDVLQNYFRESNEHVGEDYRDLMTQDLAVESGQDEEDSPCPDITSPWTKCRFIHMTKSDGPYLECRTGSDLVARAVMEQYFYLCMPFIEIIFEDPDPGKKPGNEEDIPQPMVIDGESGTPWLECQLFIPGGDSRSGRLTCRHGSDGLRRLLEEYIRLVQEYQKDVEGLEKRCPDMVEEATEAAVFFLEFRRAGQESGYTPANDLLSSKIYDRSKLHQSWTSLEKKSKERRLLSLATENLTAYITMQTPDDARSKINVRQSTQNMFDSGFRRGIAFIGFCVLGSFIAFAVCWILMDLWGSFTKNSVSPQLSKSQWRQSESERAVDMVISKASNAETAASAPQRHPDERSDRFTTGSQRHIIAHDGSLLLERRQPIAEGSGSKNCGV